MGEETGELSIVSSAGEDSEIREHTVEQGSAEIHHSDSGTDIQPDVAEKSGETGQIRDQIENTRREMGQTIDAIQEKLSFENISEQVKDQVSEQINSAVETARTAVYEAAIKKTGEFMMKMGKKMKKIDIVKTAGENPIPFILIGLGAGLLVFKRFNKTSAPKTNWKNDEKKSNKSSLLESAQNKITSAASQTYESISNVAGSAYEHVADAAGSAYQGVGRVANDAYGKVGDLGAQAHDTYSYHLEENPLIVGVVALAVGAAVGLAIPSSAYENNLLGETRENLLTKAEEVTRGAVENARQVVSDEIGKSLNEVTKNQKEKK